MNDQTKAPERIWAYGQNEPLMIWRDQIKIARAALGQDGDA